MKKTIIALFVESYIVKIYLERRYCEKDNYHLIRKLYFRDF